MSEAVHSLTVSPGCHCPSLLRISIRIQFLRNSRDPSAANLDCLRCLLALGFSAETSRDSALQLYQFYLSSLAINFAVRSACHHQAFAPSQDAVNASKNPKMNCIRDLHLVVTAKQLRTPIDIKIKYRGSTQDQCIAVKNADTSMLNLSVWRIAWFRCQHGDNL